MKKVLFTILTVFFCMTAFQTRSCAQFKSEAFSQSYSTEEDADTTEHSLFSVKDFYRQLSHKDSVAKIGTLFAGSTILVGGQQIYQKQYWKLPIIYGGIGAGLGMGFHYRNQYKSSLNAYNAAFELDPETTLSVDKKAKNLSTMMFAASGAIYWGALMDGVINFEKGTYPHAGKATLYSLLCPGLGQAYNHEYWKIPIYWGALSTSYAFYTKNKVSYDAEMIATATEDFGYYFSIPDGASIAGYESNGDTSERIIVAQCADEAAAKAALGDLTFDSVCDFIGFVPAQLERDVRLFKGKTKQYIYICARSPV